MEMRCQGVGIADQSRPLHGAKMFLPHGQQLGELMAGGELPRRHDPQAPHPRLMLRRQQAESRRRRELAFPIARKVYLHAALIVGGIDGAALGGGRPKPGGLERDALKHRARADHGYGIVLRRNHDGVVHAKSRRAATEVPRPAQHPPA